ncbi:hypothetical protein POL68_27805 [Stigmatella sp. ncwal1]|uniref:Outer membrane protein beta-barrel domain-containing protein n=1 Tax=Stigmatella ashevillensis TaxID=2995309 RepID=A0ABT5DGV0_9BACT|nr:hypothetical protein [Stigmatella ashevillena]MDC0712299.1 hypothetical protein [Stigmatella ashevillena]
MKLLHSCLGGALALGVLFAPSASEAANTRLGLGADYWVDHGASFQLTLGFDTRLVGPLDLGARFGLAFVPDEDTIGIPIDLTLRANLSRRFYLEGLVGPWILFEGDTFRTHAALGFGVKSGALSFGVEAGYLTPDPTIGLRLSYRF